MAMTNPMIWRIGASFGIAGISLGAFGAHALQKRISDPKQIKNWETASHYLLIHAVVLLGVSLHPRLGRKALTGTLITCGTVMFSGSIYGLVLGSPGLRKVLGPVTPLGGLLLIAGWTSMLF